MIQEERCRQAKDKMARHGSEPLGSNRGGIDAGHRVNGKALELAKSHPPLHSVQLRMRDGVDDPFPTLRNGRMQGAARLQLALAVAQRGVTGEKFAVRADERVQASGAVADQGVELLEILRQ